MLLSVAIWSVVVLWVGSEVYLTVTRRARENVAAGADRASLWIVWVTITLAVVAAIQLAPTGLGALPGDGRAWAVAGLVVIVLGLVVRWTAIVTLKQAFTVDVAIAPEQRIVERGLYRILRHPSYSGGLLSFLGLGLVYANGLCEAVLLVPITAAYLYRIHVEEAALRAAFGEDFVRYSSRTWRLIPFVY